MIIVMRQVLQLILFAAVGYILCKLGKAKSEHTKLLSSLQVYLFLPCNIINTYSANFTVAYISEKYPLLLASFVIMGIMILIADLFAKMLVEKSYQQSVYRYSLTVSNYGFFGYPLVSGLFGDLMLQNAMIFALPISMYTYTMGYAMLTKTKFSLKGLFNPVITASFLGAIIGLFGLKLPYTLNTLIEKSSACMAPIAMLLAGMVISEFDFFSLLKGRNNYIVSFMRLLVIPCVIAGSLKVLGFEDIILPALMMHAMPCGLNTIVFPRLVGEDCRPGASLALISSLLACITIPICVTIFT